MCSCRLFCLEARRKTHSSFLANRCFLALLVFSTDMQRAFQDAPRAAQMDDAESTPSPASPPPAFEGCLSPSPSSPCPSSDGFDFGFDLGAGCGHHSGSAAAAATEEKESENEQARRSESVEQVRAIFFFIVVVVVVVAVLTPKADHTKRGKYLEDTSWTRPIVCLLAWYSTTAPSSRQPVESSQVQPRGGALTIEAHACCSLLLLFLSPHVLIFEFPRLCAEPPFPRSSGAVYALFQRDVKAVQTLAYEGHIMRQRGKRVPHMSDVLCGVCGT